MKKYKHIRTGSIAEEGSGKYTISKGQEYQEVYIPKWVVENSNDWQEVKEKEYTILAFISLKTRDKGVIYSQDKYLTQYNLILNDELYITSLYSIYQVRRESDGEVFQIGDIVDDKSILKNPSIDKITLDSDGLLFITRYGAATINQLVKVKPKEWEITAFKLIDGSITKAPFNLGENYYLNDNIGGKPCKIYSVKRLSDGVEFKIGDTITLDGSEQFTGKISKFEINRYNRLIVYYAGHDDITVIKKVKYTEPLFTTEDGIGIYEGDNFVVVSLIDIEECTMDSEVIMKPYDIWEECKFYELITNKTRNFLGFSTREKAEEYILMNKPCLSLNDVKSINTYSHPTSTSDILIRKTDLTKLVKSKLKQ